MRESQTAIRSRWRRRFLLIRVSFRLPKSHPYVTGGRSRGRVGCAAPSYRDTKARSIQLPTPKDLYLAPMPLFTILKPNFTMNPDYIRKKKLELIQATSDIKAELFSGRRKKETTEEFHIRILQKVMRTEQIIMNIESEPVSDEPGGPIFQKPDSRPDAMQFIKEDSQ